MQKKELIKWLESLPDDTNIRIIDISQIREYPYKINDLHYPVYCGGYNYLDEEYNYLNKEEYKSLSEEEKKEFDELALIEINTDY